MKFAVTLGNCQEVCRGKSVFFVMWVGKLLLRRNCLNNIHVIFLSEKTKEKTKKVRSMDKILVRKEESGGAAIQRCFDNTVFRKISVNSQETTCAGVSFWWIFRLETCSFIEMWLEQRCSPMNFAKFLRTSIL